jgi:hypothetical protein
MAEGCIATLRPAAQPLQLGLEFLNLSLGFDPRLRLRIVTW